MYADPSFRSVKLEQWDDSSPKKESSAAWKAIHLLSLLRCGSQRWAATPVIVSMTLYLWAEHTRYSLASQTKTWWHRRTHNGAHCWVIAAFQVSALVSGRERWTEMAQTSTWAEFSLTLHGAGLLCRSDFELILGSLLFIVGHICFLPVLCISPLKKKKNSFPHQKTIRNKNKCPSRVYGTTRW